MIRNKSDGRIYVGQSANCAKREMQHIRALRRGDHRNIRLQRAFQRDGEAAFEFSVIEYCDQSIITEREQFWIDANSILYNICPAGGSSLGVKRSDETRAKQSAMKKGKTGRVMSPESIAKGVATRKARWAVMPKRRESPEASAKRGASLRARWAVTPKKSPDAEGRKRISEAQKRRVVPGNVKLTNEQILQIRSSTEIGRVLSARYGVGETQIHRIKSGECWKGLSDV